MTENLRATAASSAKVADELAIIRIVSRVARAQDDLDAAAYRSCFTDVVWLEAAVIIPNWQPGEISADELTRLTFETLSRAQAIHHLVTNHEVEIEGDEATCEADLLAVSVGDTGDGAKGSILGGRYFMKLRRTEGGWLIRERKVTRRYQLSNLHSNVEVAARPRDG